MQILNHFYWELQQLRVVSKKEKILFPVIVSLIVPPAATLVGMLMFGNLFRECEVIGRLEYTAKNALINTITIGLGLSVGAKLLVQSS